MLGRLFSRAKQNPEPVRSHRLTGETQTDRLTGETQTDRLTGETVGTHSPVLLGEEVGSVVQPFLLRRQRAQSR